MKFEERAINESLGWCLAHSLTCNGRKIGKAELLTKELVDELIDAGISKAQVFQLDADDLDENTAALKAATLVAGNGIRVEPAGRGRANLIAESDGLFLPAETIDQLNRLDDAFSAASKAAYSKVTRGDLVATIKLVPYGLPSQVLENTDFDSQCEVRPFNEFSAQLIVSCPKTNGKTISILENRLAGVRGRLTDTTSCDHTLEGMMAALKSSPDTDLILMLGASAISDVRDILPASVVAAGGEITKLGMPADPGNLLMLATLGGTTVIGLPGCARSPALNGFDWILERFSAGLALDSSTLSAMGTGGLLKEPAGRRAPRNPDHTVENNGDRTVAAIVLAAGRSSRAGSTNKLLSRLGAEPVIRTTVQTASKAAGGATFVVTGAHHQKVSNVLNDTGAAIVHNDGYELGMGTSIAKGVAALPASTQFALLCLGDMPFVQSQTYEALTNASQQYGMDAIFIPTFHGKRGHPVLWGKRYFRELSALTGDIGGRNILSQNPEKIVEVPVDDPGILIDLDTPEMLAQFGITPVTP